MKIQAFDFHSDLLRAILWQYENAPKLNTLAHRKAADFEHSNVAFWHHWYRDVFNIDTANDFGLAVWARILDVSLGIDVAPSDKTKTGIGFDKKRNFKGNFRRNSDYILQLTTGQKTHQLLKQ
ncbi:phage protein [Xenorhabdus budapestensis]|uniref:Phage protein n=1 Tax=Xenorhabdus budapestensis TaxID=290110 RepID=A0A2D0J162_XENBU|nr:DUF2612 domain-containing protein [Xenorhabdus budapestensis]PHM28035.1 phage protein [Xenorhabdus budapestensis]